MLLYCLHSHHHLQFIHPKIKMFLSRATVLPIPKNNLYKALNLLVNRSNMLFYSDTSNAGNNNTNQKAENSDNQTEPLLETKYKELHTHYLTVLADMENLRVRTRREVDQASSFSITKFAKDILGILDILQSALGSVPVYLRPKPPGEKITHRDVTVNHVDDSKSNETTRVLNDLYSGLEMTHSELINALKRHGIESFDSLYTTFDPNLHMALYDVPRSSTQLPESIVSDESLSKHPIVIDEQKQGFKIKDRILRPAQVGIAR